MKFYIFGGKQIYTWKGSFIKRQTSVATSDNEWQRVVQQVTTNDNEWQRVVKRLTTIGTTIENEWQRVTKNDIEWQRMTASDKTIEYESE